MTDEELRRARLHCAEVVLDSDEIEELLGVLRDGRNRYRRLVTSGDHELRELAARKVALGDKWIAFWTEQLQPGT